MIVSVCTNRTDCIVTSGATAAQKSAVFCTLEQSWEIGILELWTELVSAIVHHCSIVCICEAKPAAFGVLHNIFPVFKRAIC